MRTINSYIVHVDGEFDSKHHKLVDARKQAKSILNVCEVRGDILDIEIYKETIILSKLSVLRSENIIKTIDNVEF